MRRTIKTMLEIVGVTIGAGLVVLATMLSQTEFLHLIQN